MKAPVLPLLIAFIFLLNPSFAQTNGKSLLKFSDHHYALAANKNGQLAITTVAGEVAFADQANGSWHTTYVDEAVKGPSDKVRIFNICYFNADTAFVSGVVYNSHNRSDEIYHTTDGGKNWQLVKFGSEGPIDAASFLDNGEAWLSIRDKDLAYTKDYGFTWKQLTVPYDSADSYQSFSRIFFNKSAGIIGSRRNKLAYTNDNCKSWTIIPTPYSQGIHIRINESNKEDSMAVPINQVAIFKNYLLVQQENQVYYSDIHKIQWKRLPEYKGFYTDPENSALFFYHNNGSIVKCDNELHPVISYDSISHPYFITCKNGCLYVLGRNKLWQVNNSNQLVETPLYTDEAATGEPVKFGYNYKYYGCVMGNIGNVVYTKREQKWEYAFTLPFSTDGGSLAVKNTDVILFSRGDSVFYYNILGKRLWKLNGAKVIRDFSSIGIQKIIFTRGYGSCARVGEESMVYTLYDNQFVMSNRYGSGSAGERFAKDYPDSIDQRKVTGFVQKIPAIYSKQVRADELGFTREDYDSCKRSILKFKSTYEAGKEEEYPRWEIENPDFTKLMALVDSVKTMSPELTNWYFLMQENSSTIHNWYDIKFVNSNGEELKFNNEEYYSNGFYCPWQVKLNDLYSVSTAYEIRQFIKDVYPGFLKEENRARLIQGLVRVLYHHWERGE
ncbi:hypothetical protein A4D02_08845 [Niastella koreensis]|uniref:Photosynthesis system II assembly factor Ycf48/Hcf136-like domain-containing protein n=2 Tax=Niastella koreensis TaxID=354356 RepID=G8TQ98_NIAKG|nr:hypothetical protein [Niastella koreensis]AEW02112.1 hypothetical protein Niako_5882 [Niastella koreensis GR20-10]OQP48799.1 hypothetical protein A4D02_08845 [Niastella koreensis]